MFVSRLIGKQRFRKLGAIFLFTHILLFQFVATGISAENTLSFDKLKKRLVRAGFDPVRIEDIYRQPAVTVEMEGVPKFFIHSEARLNYNQFLSRKSIQNAKKYMKIHQKALEQTEKTFGVDKEIITAIMLVETRLGTYTGNTPIINTLSTLSALSDPEFRERFWLEIPAEKRFSKTAYEKKAMEKSAWAYEELKAFLNHTVNEEIDPVFIKGSYAGAMGIAQFMPSNIIKLAVDGDNDGRIDLFNHKDAMMSIANYLKNNNWQMGMNGEKAYRVLLTYNYSKPYANTLLKIAERLKK